MPATRLDLIGTSLCVRSSRVPSLEYRWAARRPYRASSLKLTIYANATISWFANGACSGKVEIRLTAARMIFIETNLHGAFVVELDRREDSRGFFARSFCREFTAHGLNPLVAQANVAFSRAKGTVRGMHFQFPPSPKPSWCG